MNNQTETNLLVLKWKCHLPNLLGEILGNPGTGILLRPIQIAAGILEQVAESAARINDPELNALMCRLTLYAIADPECDDYDPELCEAIYTEAELVKRERERQTDGNK